jgi:hypothetical protein
VRTFIASQSAFQSFTATTVGLHDYRHFGGHRDPASGVGGSCIRQGIERASARRISAVNFLETAVVVDSARDPIASRRLNELIQRAEIAIEPVTETQAHIAREAYRDSVEAGVTRRNSTLVTVLPMRSQKTAGSPRCLKARTSSRRMFSAFAE